MVSFPIFDCSVIFPNGCYLFILTSLQTVTWNLVKLLLTFYTWYFSFHPQLPPRGSPCVPCVGRSTRIFLAKYFLLSVAVSVVLEAVPAVGRQTGASSSTRTCAPSPGCSAAALGRVSCVSSAVCAKFCNTLTNPSIWICCDISSVKMLAMKCVIGKESAVIDTKIVSQIVQTPFWNGLQVWCRWGVAGYPSLSLHWLFLITLALQTGQRYFFSYKVLILILVCFLLALFLNSKPEQ